MEKLSKLVLGVATAAIGMAVAQSAHAQAGQFNYTSAITPPSITQGGGTITATGASSTTTQLAGPLVPNGDQITLGTFSETGSNTTGFNGTFTDSVILTSVVPPGGPGTSSVTENFSGTFQQPTPQFSSVSVTMPSTPLVFDFGSAGVYTISGFGNTVGTSNGADQITITGKVFYTPAAAVPEPGTWAAFAFTGFGAAGLMLRARKSRGSMTA